MNTEERIQTVEDNLREIAKNLNIRINMLQDEMRQMQAKINATMTRVNELGAI